MKMDTKDIVIWVLIGIAFFILAMSFFNGG
jgi:hypothetical protein